MRREVSTLSRSRLSVGRPPPDPFGDGVVTLRLPEPTDVSRLARYGSDKSLLEGTWIGRPPPGIEVDHWANESVRQWLAGWTDQGGVDGGVLIIDEEVLFVGILFLVPRSRDTLELTYGVLPSSRGRGIASRAARLASNWSLTEGGFSQVKLRIAEHHAASRRVAEKAGFRFEERFETYVTGTGKTHVDILYVKTQVR